MKSDPIVDAVCADLQARSAVGIQKYGLTLSAAIDTNSLMYWLQHAYEETLDRANYLKAAIESMRRGRPLTTPDTDYEKVLNAELSTFPADVEELDPRDQGYLDALKVLKARLHNMTPTATCTYPSCSCPVSFPAGFKPGLTSCPRSGTT